MQPLSLRPKPELVLGVGNRRNEVGLLLMKRWKVIEVSVLAVGCGRGQAGAGAREVPDGGGVGAGAVAGWRYAADGGRIAEGVGRIGIWSAPGQLHHLWSTHSH